MGRLTIATAQMPCTLKRPVNPDRVEHLVLEAAAEGAQVILLQELFATPYFIQRHIHLAHAEEYQYSRILQQLCYAGSRIRCGTAVELV